MIYGRLIHEACARFGYWPLIILVVHFGALVAYRDHQKTVMEKSEKQLVIEACRQAGLIDDCAEWVETHHGACFDFNYTGADLYGTSHLDRRGYRNCLKVGLEKYATELRQSERATRALQHELLN